MSAILDITPITHWRIVFSGFLQKNGQMNGCVLLWRQLYERYASPNRVVDSYLWNSDVSDLAKFIVRASSEVPDVCIAGYSWGGYAAANLAWKLDEYDIDVQTLVLCDAVYRHWYRLGSWRAMVPWSRIKIPPNVGQAWWFRQRRNLPMGHQVVKSNRYSATVIHDPIELPLRHQQMDDAREWHDLVLKQFSIAA